MHLSKILAVILLCAATLPPAAAARPSQKNRPRTSSRAQTPTPQTEITKEKIEAIVSAIEESMKKKDAAVITSYLAPDFKYKLDVRGKPTRHANRAQYIEAVRLGLELMLDITYLRKSLIITIDPDGQSATAQIEAFEMLTLAQGTVAGNSIGTTTFKIYKGKILISSIEGMIEYV